MQLRLALAGLFLMMDVSVARADSSSEDACLASHKKTQELELDKKLIEAEGQAIACSQSACPAEVREMCVDFLSRIRANEATVVLVVDDTLAKKRSEVHVVIDGHPSATALDGSAVHLDPGTHLIEYQLGDGPKHTQTLQLHEGEKDREVRLSIEGTALRAKFSPWAHVLGGLGVASLASFAVVGSVALARAHSLDKTCGHDCAVERPGAVSSVLREAKAADICLGAGLGLVAAAGLTMGLTWSKAPDAPTAALSVRPTGIGFDLKY